MTERSVRIASAVLASLGAAISAYILYVRETNGSLVCSTGGCETVQSSSYAELLGLPVAALGLAGFVVLLAAALARAGVRADVRSRAPVTRTIMPITCEGLGTGESGSCSNGT